MLMTWTDHLIQ